MCGIAGETVVTGSRALVAPDLFGMIDAVAHRGPDSAGYWRSDNGKTVLMHARTPRVDPDGGSQPMCNETGSIWVTFNGEIYDHRERLEQLRAGGHQLRSRCDTEVIPHLFEDHGPQCFEMLRGEFAFALYDNRERALYLVRDRFGTKPLFYAQTSDSLLFGSEAKSLFCHPGIDARIDRNFVLQLLLGVTMPDDSLFEGVKQVRPGHYVKISEKGISEHPYWTLSFGEENKYSSMDEAAEHFRELLDEAVKLRLDADVQIGAYLSGGLDSSTVLESMTRQYGEPIESFTIRYSQDAGDESHAAAATAQHFGIANTPIDITLPDLINNLEASVWHTELPVMNSHSSAKYVLSERASQSRKAVLTGSGADEFFIGYAMYSQQVLMEQKRIGTNGEIERRLKQLLTRDQVAPGLMPVTSYRKYSRIRSLFGNYPYQALRAVVFEKAIRPFLSGDLASQLDCDSSLSQLAERYEAKEKLTGLAPWRASQHMQISCDLPWYIATCMDDRPEMAHAMEGRTPFLDKEVTEFATRLPQYMLFNEDQGKLLIRHAMKDRLPQNILQNHTKLFWTPVRREICVLQSDAVKPYLTRKATQDAGLFHPGRIAMARHALRVLPSSSKTAASLSTLLMTVASMHMLQELFVDRFEDSRQRFDSEQRDWTIRDIQHHSFEPLAAVG